MTTHFTCGTNSLIKTTNHLTTSVSKRETKKINKAYFLYLCPRPPGSTVQSSGPSLMDEGPPRSLRGCCSWTFYSVLPAPTFPWWPWPEAPRYSASAPPPRRGPRRCEHRRWTSRTGTWWASSGPGSSLALVGRTRDIFTGIGFT